MQNHEYLWLNLHFDFATATVNDLRWLCNPKAKMIDMIKMNVRHSMDSYSIS